MSIVLLSIDLILSISTIIISIIQTIIINPTFVNYQFLIEFSISPISIHILTIIFIFKYPFIPKSITIHS